MSDPIANGKPRHEPRVVPTFKVALYDEDDQEQPEYNFLVAEGKAKHEAWLAEYGPGGTHHTKRRAPLHVSADGDSVYAPPADVVEHKVEEGVPQPATADNPRALAYTTKGKVIVKYEWVPGLVDERTNQKAHSTASILQDMFGEVLYRHEYKDGVPRSPGEFVADHEGDSKHKGVRGFWWVKLHRTFLVNRYCLSRHQIDRAFDKLVEIGLVATKAATKKTMFCVRPLFAQFAPYVAEWRERNRSKLEAAEVWRSRKSRKSKKVKR